MNSDLYFDGKKYISSSRAAKISGYVNDYIGQLCRDGKLEARMVGRSWYVGLESLIQHKKSNLIGTRSRGPRDAKTLIAEAAKVLSVATPKIEQEAPVHFTSTPSISIAAIATPIQAVTSSPQKSSQVSYPVFTTPLPTTTARRLPHGRRMLLHSAQSAMAVLALFIALWGFHFGMTVNSESQKVYGTQWNSVAPELTANVWTSVRDVVLPPIATLADAVRDWIVNSRQTIFVLSGGTPAPTAPAPAVSAPTEDAGASSGPNTGMVVVPVTPSMDQQAVVSKVRNTFSDQVNVVPKGSDNGVITPVFKQSKSDGYLYVLVPITN